MASWLLTHTSNCKRNEPLNKFFDVEHHCGRSMSFIKRTREKPRRQRPRNSNRWCHMHVYSKFNKIIQGENSNELINYHKIHSVIVDIIISIFAVAKSVGTPRCQQQGRQHGPTQRAPPHGWSTRFPRQTWTLAVDCSRC